MDTRYVYPAAQIGDLRNACLTGKGPASYQQTGDIINNPGPSEYIVAPEVCMSQSGTYILFPRPTLAGTLNAGAATQSQSGWSFHWYVAATMTEVAGGISLSGEAVQFKALVSNL